MHLTLVVLTVAALVAVAAIETLAARYAPQQAAGIPSQCKSADGLWTGFGARIGVLLYNTQKIKAEEVPRSIEDLTRPR